MQKFNSLLYQSLAEERNKLEIQAERAAALHSDIMKLYHEIHEEADDLDVREAALKAKETQLIQEELKIVKAEIDAVVQEFEKQLRNSSPDDFNLLLKKSESAITSIVQAHQSPGDFPVDRTASSSYMPQIGERVLIKADGNGAAVSTPPSRRQGQRMKRLKNLRSLSQTMKDDEVSYGPAVQTSKNTVDLRGMRLEEATLHVNMAINARGSKSVLFIIHGMGTGVLKERVLELLRNHPRIAKFEQESPMNYGCTVAYIK
ncbi:UNVERIFIED_CONTAM: Endonuclease MutS2 [Sesamum radiatum]|uniref:Endonuclease MutS2 n=1 Tax=Sesamum radiatum TaxID=300843 RepID=A0AAW2T2M1_SESRA